MKSKWLVLTLTVLLSLFAITACGSNDNNEENNANAGNNVENNEPENNENNEPAPEPEPEPEAMYEDGFYFAKEDAFSNSGWKSVVAIVVEDGVIADVTWDATSREGLPLKAEHAANGDYGMVKASEIEKEWHEQAAAVEDYLLETQDPTDIVLDADGYTDAIAGATMGVEGFFTLAEKALANGPIPAGSLTDGFYRADEEAEEDAEWKYFATVLVMNGNIVDAVYNAYNEELEVDKIAHAAAGEYGMVKASEIEKEWHEQAYATAEYLVNIQDPASAELDEEGRLDASTGSTIKVGGFFELVQKALGN